MVLFAQFTTTFWILLAASIIWEIVWKGFAMWRAARNGHKVWFWVLLITNTVGILPIIYLILNDKKRKRTI